MGQFNLKNRTIFCRDNIDILRGINSNSIDLIYLDPPFNKNKIFTAPIGSSAEGASFKDTFRKEDVKDEWVQSIKEDYDGLYKFLNGIKEYSNITSSKTNKHYLYNYCYLSYMAIRLIEMQRILKEMGSIYLHCDPAMSHYIKLLMDIIFGEKNFRNEIVWKYTGNSIPKNCYPKKHDILFFYSKTKEINYYPERILQPYSELTEKRYNHIDKEGRRYKISALRDGKQEIIYMKKGKYCDDVFTIPTERGRKSLGYPTQKPLSLLERIINVSSNKGDIILDPFCGCATTCVASEKLNRKWIGIDVSYLAYELVKKRLRKEVKGEGVTGQLDIINWDKEIIYTHTPPKRTDTNGDTNILKKYIYIISHPNYKKANLYKVGIASNLNSRLNSYQTSDPLREYKIEYNLHTHLYREIEFYIHKKFSFSHEWVNGKLNDLIKAIEEFDINEYNQLKGNLF